MYFDIVSMVHLKRTTCVYLGVWEDNVDVYVAQEVQVDEASPGNMTTNSQNISPVNQLEVPLKLQTLPSFQQVVMVLAAVPCHKILALQWNGLSLFPRWREMVTFKTSS